MECGSTSVNWASVRASCPWRTLKPFEYSCDGKVEMSLIAVKEGSFGSGDGYINRTVSPVLHHRLDLGTLWTLPSFYDSCEGGESSSSNCIYMTEWLEF